MQSQFGPEEIAQFENATWSRCAEGYVDGFGALVSEAIEPLLDEVKLSEGERVLDMGTGPGLVAARAVERGAAAVGIDFSEAMLSEAQRRHPEIEFLQASAEDLPIEDAEFDVVIGNFMLHHVAHPERVLREAFRVLRPEGRMGFTVWTDPAKLEAFGLFFAAVEEHAGATEFPHGPLFGLSDFEVFHAMARNAGYRDSSVRELPIAWQIQSIDSFLSAFWDWANLETLAPDIQRAIEATVRERAANYRQGDTYTMPNPAILLSAVK